MIDPSGSGYLTTTHTDLAEACACRRVRRQPDRQAEGLVQPHINGRCLPRASGET